MPAVRSSETATYRWKLRHLVGLPGSFDAGRLRRFVFLRSSRLALRGLAHHLPAVGYRRLIYVKPSDCGLDVNGGAFEFYNGGLIPAGGSITDDETVDFVLTQNATTRAVSLIRLWDTPLSAAEIPIASFLCPSPRPPCSWPSRGPDFY